jgi:hypothetical protein
MVRILVTLIAAGLIAVPCRGGDAGANPETLIRLEIDPAPAPSPALRYLLLPELKEMKPGNPIFNYFKCSMEQESFLFDKEAFERRERLLAMPLKELPAQDVLEYGRSVLIQADRAARLDKPDWQILEKLKTDGFNLLLPDVQQMRALARALLVRFRSEVAMGRFDDAIRTAQTMFAMSRHMGEHPTLIGDLVGIAIAAMAIGPLEEMLGQPGSPNLYWALTNLPVPLIPLRTGVEGERALVVGEFHDLYDARPMDPAQIAKFIAHMDMILSSDPATKLDKGVRGWLDARINDQPMLAAARGRLASGGLPEDRLKLFPPEQILLLDERREYEVRRDDVMKFMALPFWVAEAQEARAAQVKRPPSLFAEALTPAMKAVRRAQVRIDQRIALIRIVEALRLHAAEHGGELPASLDEVSVPMPDDPITGKPFRYERVGTSAHLRGSPPEGAEKDRFFNVHYELTVRK